MDKISGFDNTDKGFHFPGFDTNGKPFPSFDDTDKSDYSCSTGLRAEPSFDDTDKGLTN